MNQVFSYFIDRFFVVLYAGDTFIYSRTREEHLEHICAVLSRSSQLKLCVSPRKRFFVATKSEFLSLSATREGIYFIQKRSMSSRTSQSTSITINLEVY